MLSLSTPKHHNTCFTQNLLSNLQIALYSKSPLSFEFESYYTTNTSTISNRRCPNTHLASGSAESQSSKSLQRHFAVNTPVGVPACCSSFQASKHTPYGIVVLSKSSNNFWKHFSIKFELLLLLQHSSKPKTFKSLIYAYFFRLDDTHTLEHLY